MPNGAGPGSISASSRPNIPTLLTKVGQIAENPTGSGPYSARREWVNPTTPCLVAA